MNTSRPVLSARVEFHHEALRFAGGLLLTLLSSKVPDHEKLEASPKDRQARWPQEA